MPTSKWPYYGPIIPNYIGLIGGYEGIKTNNIQMGIAINNHRSLMDPPVGGMHGFVLLFKQSFTTNKISSFEAETGIYTIATFGFNYNYNITTSNNIHGFKPFIGVSFYHIQLIYGYSFYNDSKDINNDLRHNRISLRYVIPLVKLRKG